ncbi:F0F1 ATP synthase subunit B [Geminisphaera colitermitum]|uniref:F0F1 ATP synthase subunit B n=1 Tax=Geminisphaera colitermitum TaxID=1148786 RepID=UPI000158CDE7|nr:F0F1 ATP synthase subunit B [Geminisphaera colitermitum]
MFFNLTLLAAASHGPETAAESSGGITKLFNDFGIDAPLFLAQALSFTIVAVLLWKFAFKPVLATLDARNAKIEQSLKDAEAAAQKLAQAQQDAAAVIAESHAKAGEQFAAAQKAAKAFEEKARAEAGRQAAEIIEKARQANELEHKRLLEEARAEIARLVVTTTEQVLAKKLTDADRSAYNAAAVQELASLKD